MEEKKEPLRKMIAPPPLQQGSVIRLVSPAGKCDRAPMEALAGFLESSGYRVQWGNHVTAGCFQYAGSDAQRLADLQEALDDPAVNAIIASRGGYGTLRLLENLDFRGFRRHPKWVAGYSDITLLHSALHRLGYQSVHSIMARNSITGEGLPNESLQSLMEILRGEESTTTWNSHPLNRRGTTTAPLTGGNLSLLYSLTGTPFDTGTRGKILFIEDTGEYLYHLDRMMVSLRLAGKLKHLAALVVGYFTEMKDNEEPFGKGVEEIILDAVRDEEFPVAFGFPAGHDLPNKALASGGTYALEVKNESCSLVLQDAAKSVV